MKLLSYNGAIPSKEERAQDFASRFDIQRAFIRQEHTDCRAEAGSLHAGATNDLFDACIGAIMALLEVPDASLIADAIRSLVRNQERGRKVPDDVLDQASVRAAILRERL